MRTHSFSVLGSSVQPGEPFTRRMSVLNIILREAVQYGLSFCMPGVRERTERTERKENGMHEYHR